MCQIVMQIEDRSSNVTVMKRSQTDRLQNQIPDLQIRPDDPAQIRPRHQIERADMIADNRTDTDQK